MTWNSNEEGLMRIKHTQSTSGIDKSSDTDGENLKLLPCEAVWKERSDVVGSQLDWSPSTPAVFPNTDVSAGTN